MRTSRRPATAMLLIITSVSLSLTALAGGQASSPASVAATAAAPTSASVPASGPASAPVVGSVLAACDAQLTIDQATGSIGSLRVGSAKEEITRTKPGGFVEVLDLTTFRTFNPLTGQPAISNWQQAPAVDNPDATASRLSFTQQYPGAPFRIDHVLSGGPEGLRWEASVSLLPGQTDNRSVQVTWMLPLPIGWRLWAPNDFKSYGIDGVTPYRWVYGHTGFRSQNIIMPMVGIWGKRGGLAIFSPPDIQKPQITFDGFTQTISDGPGGVSRKIEDTPFLKITHHLVGLRPGKPLKLAVCLAATKPDWRPILGHYVKTYPELFDPVPAVRKVEGMYAIRGMAGADDKTLAGLKAANVTFMEIHGSFLEYSEYMTEQKLANPDEVWECKPHPGQRTSVNGVRNWIGQLKGIGVAPFVYFYNVHALPDTIEKRWKDDLMLNERRQPMRRWYTELYMHGPPDSPYGKHMIEQMDLLIKAYPEATGFFVDNYSGETMDFAHDDGVSMAHNRPAYDLNRNHQLTARICFEKAHKAGKLIMVNKLATIESACGADMVLAEGNTIASLRQHGFACVNRALFPLGISGPPGPTKVERCLQNLLVVGGTPEQGFFVADAETMKAYRPLTDAMIGKRWLLEPDPITLPEGHEGNIFRIDPAAPQPGTIVVAMVNLNKSWKSSIGRQDGGVMVSNLEVKVRLAEAEQIKTVTWLSVENSSQPPVKCNFDLHADQLTIKLPPCGAAGILRLSKD